MKKQISLFSPYLLNFVGSLWLGVLATVLASIPLRFAVGNNPLAENLWISVFFAAAMTAWLFLSSYRRGYKKKALPLPKLSLFMAILFLLQQIFAYIFGYVYYMAGAATHLSLAIFLGHNPAVYDLKTHLAEGVPLWGYHVLMLALMLVLYVPAMVGGEYVGSKRREKDRAELTGEGETP